MLITKIQGGATNGYKICLREKCEKIKNQEMKTWLCSISHALFFDIWSSNF